MCGFFFNSSLKGNYNYELNINKFNKLKHRGIDNSSHIQVATNKKIFLGHHRLAINDLDDRGNQPFKSDCDNYYLLFNGEIFNFKDLKKNIDYKYKTETDTEVILAGYKIFGKDFFKKLEGFYSIAILDLKKNILIITIDPTSSKSMYYENLEKSLSVASELTSLAPNNSNLHESINRRALEIYIQYGYIHAPHSIYNNIYKLEPGELIEFNLDNHKNTKFKNFNKHAKYLSKQSPEQLIVNAHKSRLVSDVPVATMLSSGVDSTLSNYIYSKKLNLNKETFTLGIKNSNLDESKLALNQTKNLNLNHKTIMVDEKIIIDELAYVCSYLDEPFADSSSVLVSLLSKEISKDYKVVISSDGGDELLYGYSRHKFYYLFSWIRHLPKIIKFLIKKILMSNSIIFLSRLFQIDHFEIKVNKILSFLEQSNFLNSYLCLIKVVPDFITKKLLKDYKGDTLIRDFHKHYNYNSIKDIDYNFYLPSINFKNDRCGMHYSLEIREPLLNFDLVRHFYDKKMNLVNIFSPKKYFRNILKNRDIFVSKKKRGLSFSQQTLLEYNNYEILFYLEKNISILSPFFNTKFIKKIIEDFKIKKKWTSEIWIILSFTMWYKKKCNEHY